MAWPLHGSEAGFDLDLIQTSLLLLFDTSCSDANLVHLHDKSSGVCIKTRSTQASLPSKGQARVVQKVVNAIHRINYHPVDSMVCFDNIYPLHSDLADG